MHHRLDAPMVHAGDAPACGRAEDQGMPDWRRPEPTWHEELTRLIEHGRDREAAVLASQRLPPLTQGAFMDPRMQLDEIVPLLNKLVAPLDDAQLDAPTPCAQFAVRGVLEHMVGGATAFAAAFRGEAPPEHAAGTDLVAAFPIAMAELQQAVRSPGALDRTITAPFGDVPGDAFVRFVALDGLVHGWDIATATGQPYQPPATLVAEVYAFAQEAIVPAMREADMFAVPTEAPVDATDIEQLVALTGRRVERSSL
jgi:uncharacterized protein (TIGR03086 family)